MTDLHAPTTYGPHQLADWLAVPHWQTRRAHELGLIPDPDTSGRWSHIQAEQIRGSWPQTAAALDADRCLGVHRSAELLAERTGLPVQPDDIDSLRERGLLPIADYYKKYPLYQVARLEALAVDHAELLAQLVDERTQWIAASLSAEAAAARLNWRVRDLPAAAAKHGVLAGRFNRYATTDIEALATSEAFAGERLLGPDEAATHLEIRRTDWDYIIAAGWINPATVVTSQVGRRKTVDIPLYRQGDVDALRDLPGVDWEDVRSVRKGEPSRLREFAAKPPTRAQIIRWFTLRQSQQHQVEFWAWWDNAADTWYLDWDLRDGQPAKDLVRQAIQADPVIGQHAGRIRLGTNAGAAIRFARAMLEPGAAVILDTETTDLHGRICEIAVIDAATGATLLDTLIQPGQPISAGAQAVHGITEADLEHAPTLDQVLPQLLEATRGRTILAYNAEYDHGVITSHAHALDLNPAHLADWANWGCLMLNRSAWAHYWRWLPLGGGHRALGDTHAAREVLLAMTAPTR